MPSWVSYKMGTRNPVWNQDKRNINSLRYEDDTTLMAESEEELESPLMRVKEESERASLKLNIKKRLRSWHPASLLHGKQKGKR